jgi:hypothetical protein
MCKELHKLPCIKQLLKTLDSDCTQLPTPQNFIQVLLLKRNPFPPCFGLTIYPINVSGCFKKLYTHFELP